MTKTLGDIVVVDATIESASKARREWQGKEIREWKIKLFIPALGFKEWGAPISMDVTWAEDLYEAQQVRVKLRRQKLKEVDGVTKDGNYDTDFYWGIVEWDCKDPLVTSTTSPNGHTGGSDSRGDVFRTKQELRWTEALHMASRLTCKLVEYTNGIDLVEYSITMAHQIYDALEFGVPETQEEQQQEAG